MTSLSPYLDFNRFKLTVSMNTTYTKMGENALQEILYSRISLRPIEPKVIHLNEIVMPLDIEQEGALASNTVVQGLIFKECLFKKYVLIQGQQRRGQLTFENCIFEEDVDLTMHNVTMSGINSLKKNLTLRFPYRKKEVISNLNVDGELVIYGDLLELSIFNINKDNDKGQLSFTLYASALDLKMRDVYAQKLTLENGSFNEINILKNVETHFFEISSIKLLSAFTIKGLKAEELIVSDIQGDNPSLNILDKCAIGHFALPINAVKNVDISFCNIRWLQLSGRNDSESVINIQEVHVNGLLFFKIFNRGNITLRQINIQNGGQLSVLSSNLGKTDFIHCDFNSATLEFENSKLSEIFLSESNFPKKVIDGKTISYGQAQLAFGQLATAYQKQGDTIRALEYSAREVEAHYYNVRGKKFWDTINLGLNSISNDFGRNWSRGILFSFTIGLVFFCALLITTDEYELGWPNFDLKLLPGFLRFMNPLRFFELDTLFSKEQPLKLNSWSFLWDFLGRVFVAYGFYQTIQAFRRFGRK